MEDSLGARIRDARQRAKLTQAQLAHRIGISRTALHDIETGTTKDPRSSLIAALANALQVTTDFLHGLDNAPSPEGW